VTEICLAFPEAEREMLTRHAAFLVRTKKFAYYLDDHHGDGIVSVCVRTDFGRNAELAQQDPDRFYIPAYIGPRGWVGLRLDVPDVDWDEVRDALEGSYLMAAPRSLARLLG